MRIVTSQSHCFLDFFTAFVEKGWKKLTGIINNFKKPYKGQYFINNWYYICSR